ncbi:MAG: hypothetical protein JO114_07270 [Planctomycetaceae bacterium]|nr:hypothetical protein [Planctomycetaceae bacterium]
MATPHVAGCVALLMAAQPEAPVSDTICPGVANQPDSAPVPSARPWWTSRPRTPSGSEA